MLRQARTLLLFLVLIAVSVPGYQALSAPSHGGWRSSTLSYSDPPISINASLGQSQSTALSPDEESPYVPGQLLVQFAPDTPEEEKAAIHERFGAEVIDEIEPLGVQILQVPEEATSMVYAYQREPTVNFAEPDYFARIAGWPDGPVISGRTLTTVEASPAQQPNDPLYTQMWNLAKIQAERGWDITVGRSDVTIAVIDTGADASHSDLQGKLLSGFDFVNRDGDPADDQGHGTHVSGTAAAATNNNVGIAGMAWEVKVMPLKALSASGAGAHSWIANAIVWAADRGADVINMSLGGPYTSATMRQAVDYAWREGVVIVAAAGNGNTSNPTYPAAYQHVIGVSATTQNDQRAAFSNYGSYVAIASPGVSILSTTRGSNYQSWSGTSMATPHVAGLAALLKSIHPDWTNGRIRDTLESTAVDLGSPGWDAIFGHGRIDAYAALNSNPPTPTATPTTPAPSATPSNPPPPPNLEQELIDAINEERAALGLPPLQRDERLMEAARRHSRDMADNNRCSHSGTDGSDPFDRIRDTGYPIGSASEVIACGYQSASDTLRAWKNSPRHWTILTNEDLIHIGCGVSQASNGSRYWTCNPARPNTQSPTPDTPTPTPTQRTRTETPVPTDTPAATETPVPTDTATATETPVPTDIPTLTHTPSPAPDPVNPETVTITPEPQYVGWVVSNEGSTNHFADDDIYAGIHGGQVYMGAVQFDLSVIPRDAKINWGRLTVVGQTRDFVGDRGSWSLSLLSPAIDANWPSHGYLQIRDAPQEHLILPILGNSDLQRDKKNVFNFDASTISALERRLPGTQRASFRFEGPKDGSNNLFSWDTGHGTGGLGKPPILTINYTTDTGEPPTATPEASPTPESSPTPDDSIDVLQLTPPANSVGWVASHQPSGNNFGDDDVYAGIYNGNVYIGAMRFDLSSLPVNIEVVEAELLLTGQTRQYLSGEGAWHVEMLESSIDNGWTGHGYADIANASSAGSLKDLSEGDFTLESDQLDVEQVNRLGLTATQRTEVGNRRRGGGYVSIRIRGPSTGTSNVFSWDSGYGTGGLSEPPTLIIKYREQDSPGPSPTPTASVTPTPSSGGGDTSALIDAINSERIRRGLAALQVDSRLVQAAQEHSTDLAENDRWSHTGSDDSTPQERISRTGYPLAEGDEVLAANSTDINEIVNAWLSNVRHEGILMDADYEDIGAGYAFNANSTYGDYWTVLVARPAGGGGTPGESQVQITPSQAATGWVVSNEPMSNHFGDDDMYSGFYNGLTYAAAVQFNLSEVPADAQITEATLELTGQTDQYLQGNGTWTVRLLESSVDFDWSSHGYSAITSAEAVGTVGAPLTGTDLGAGRVNTLRFDNTLLIHVEDRVDSTRLLSLRIDGPASGDNDVFSWDSGFGIEGLDAPPVLTIKYTLP